MWKAPIFWVIPPCYLSAMFDFLKKSINVVFPWSTCPIIVTTADFFLGSYISVASGYTIFSIILTFVALLFRKFLLVFDLSWRLKFLFILGGGNGGWIFFIGGGGFKNGLDANPCSIFVHLKSMARIPER